MTVYNSLNVNDTKLADDLYLVRYSHEHHPDYIIVKYDGIIDDNIKCIDKKGSVKKIPVKKAKYRLFSDVHEMSRSLYDCFIKRNVELIPEYNKLFLESQDERPEIWI